MTAAKAASFPQRILRAIVNDDLERLRGILARVPRWEEHVDHHGSSLLHWAVQENARKIVYSLLAGSSRFLNSAASYGHTPLRIAAGEGHTHLVRRLLEAGAMLHDPAFEEWGSPLTIAVIFGHAEVVRMLLRAGADPDRKEGGADDEIHTARSLAEKSKNRKIRRAFGLLK